MKQPLRLISKKLINNKEIEADPYSFALTTAHYALAPRAKSRAELHAHLKKRGVEDEIAAAVLDELELQGLLNDLEFAQIGHAKTLLMRLLKILMMKMNTKWL